MTVALFPGQGSQAPGMGKGLVNRSIAASEVFDEASDALGLDLRKLCWESSASELARTENTQVAVAVVSVAAWRVWVENGGDANAVTGHSIGAISAAIAGGYLSLMDGIKLARKRGLLMAAAPGIGSMLAVAVIGESGRQTALDAAEAASLDVAAINGERQLVFSGDTESILSAQKIFGAKSARLDVSHGFHSRLMDPVMNGWKELVNEANFTEGNRPLLSSTLTGYLNTPAQVANDLYLGLRQTVRWDYVLEQAENFNTWVYLGTAKSLSRLKRNQPQSRRIHIIEDANVSR